MRPQRNPHAAFGRKLLEPAARLELTGGARVAREFRIVITNESWALQSLFGGEPGSIPTGEPLGLIPWGHVERCRGVGVWWVSRWRRIDVGS